MKVKSRLIDHRIPLCPEIVSELRQWQSVFGSKGYVFPSPTGKKHIGRESIEKMYRAIKPNSAKWWRLDYSIGSKRKTLSVGVYPDIG